MKNKYFGHMEHINGISELWGPFSSKKDAIMKMAKEHYSRFDESFWSSAVSEDNGVDNPKNVKKYIWQRKHTDV